MFRSVAIIPAAGASRRMGRSKLLLTVDGEPLIRRVLGAWLASKVDGVVVVVRGDDPQLIKTCSDLPVELAKTRSATPDMKASVRLGLAFAKARRVYQEEDAWLVAPADVPWLSAPLINRVLDAYDPTQPRPVCPVVAARRGHPALLPWSLAERLDLLGPEQGIGDLLDRVGYREASWHAAEEFRDVDSPEEYAKLRSAAAGSLFSHQKLRGLPREVRFGA